MAEQTTPTKKRRRAKRTNPATRKNAVHVTVYDPQGSDVPESVLAEAALAVLDVAKQHNLVIATATT
jgi:hypothetical protein